jgi:hypothetical protein
MENKNEIEIVDEYETDEEDDIVVQNWYACILKTLFPFIIGTFILLVFCTCLALGIVYLPEDQSTALFFSERYHIDNLMIATMVGILVYIAYFISIFMAGATIGFVCISK